VAEAADMQAVQVRSGAFRPTGTPGGPLFDEGASFATWHELTRDAVRGTFAFAEKFFPAAMPAGIDASNLPFANAGEWEKIAEGDPRYEQCEATFGMDFANYTVGGEIEGRANYDSNHDAYKEALALIRGRVWEMGWRADRFDQIDSRIGEVSYRRDNDPDKVERYGRVPQLL
jgi:hypothetical protein